jgi:plastocyanin
MMPFGRSVLSLLVAGGLVAVPAAADTHVVQVLDNSFSPSQLTICLGDTVRWEWVGVVAHSTTSGNDCGSANGAWDSGVLGAGATFELTFDSLPPQCATDASPGADTCNYFCTAHCAPMSGVITVAEQATSALAIGVNKLRVAHDPTEGRGGTLKGSELWSGASFDDVAGDLMVTVTLTGDLMGGGSFMIDDTESVSPTRGDFVERLPRNTGEPLNLRAISVRGTHDADLAKVTVKYETNGVDLSTVVPGSVQAHVELVQPVDGACGLAVVVATFSGPVSL